MLYLRQSTASQSVTIGRFVDDTDGKTSETGLTIANTDIQLSKNGAAAANKNSGGATHDQNGYYTITLDATDTDTVGRLQLTCVVAGALEVQAEYHVLEESVYDNLFAASAVGPLTAAQVNAECDTALADYDAPTKAELDAGLAALNDLDSTAAQAAAAAALAAYNAVATTDLPANFADLAITLTTGLVSVGTNNDKSGYSISGTLTTLDALDTAQDSQHATTQSAIGALNDLDSTAAQAAAAAALTAYDPPTKAELDSGLAALNDPTAAAIRAEIDANSTQLAAIIADTGELQTDLTNGGRLDLLIDAIKAVTDSLPDGGALTTLLANVAAILVDTDNMNTAGVNVSSISGSATAADNLEASALGIVKGTMSGTPTTTSIPASNLPSGTNDTYNGRVMVVTSGDAAGEATEITDYVGATKTLTVTALASTPAADDTFVIV